MVTPRKSVKMQRLLDRNLLTILERGKVTRIAGGDAVEVDIPASTMEVIRKRLKDVAGHPPPVESPLQTALAKYYGSRGWRTLAYTDGPVVRSELEGRKY